MRPWHLPAFTTWLRTAGALVLRDWRIRFRRTLLGMAWFCIPMLGLAALAMSAGQATGLYEPAQAHRHLVHLLAGMVLWQLFADAWLEPLRLSRRAAPMLRAFSFDARLILAAGVLSAMAAFGIRLPILLAAIWWFGVMPGPDAWVLLPGVGLLVSAGAALACFSLPAGLVLNDLRYGLPIAQWALLAVTPILYDPPAAGPLAWVVHFNPLSTLVPPLRDLMLEASPPISAPAWLAAGVACVLPLLGLGLLYYGSRIRLAVAYVGR